MAYRARPLVVERPSRAPPAIIAPAELLEELCRELDEILSLDEDLRSRVAISEDDSSSARGRCYYDPLAHALSLTIALDGMGKGRPALSAGI